MPGWISEPGTIEEENESGSAELGGVVTRVKDSCHIETPESGTPLRSVTERRRTEIPNSLYF